MPDKDFPDFVAGDDQESERLFRLQSETTQTLDLRGLLTSDITSSGSFDIRGGIWASTFGKLLQSLPIPAFLVDGHQDILVVNQAFARIDRDLDSHQVRHITSLFSNQSDGANASELLEEVFRSRRPGSVQAKLHLGNSTIWARLSIRSIRIVDQRLALVLVEDLTHERKLLLLSRKYREELEEKVEERTAELRESNTQLQNEIKERERAEGLLIQSEQLRAVGEMSAGVAHNLNNLIQVLLGLVHAAMKDLESQDLGAARKELDLIVQTLRHGSETVKRLQDFAGMGAEGSYGDGKAFDLSALTKQAVEFSKPFWQTYPQRKGIKVDLSMAISDGCSVRGNKGQIFEVLVNLIKNAAEALTEGGRIDITTSLDKEDVVFAILDTGAGIREEDMARLFTPFFTTKAGTGTGLGLATSRRIIDSHGGAISVQSTPGKGTTFSVKLPLSPSRPEQNETS